MVGSLLAGCEESPGELVFNGKQYKSYHRAWVDDKSYSKDRYFPGRGCERRQGDVPEGIEGQVAYRGSLAAVAHH